MVDRVAKNTLVPLLLRAGLAVIFIFHGWDKVGGQGHEWGTSWNRALPQYQQLLVAWGELVGGAALALGLLSRLAALGLAVIMGGAIYTVHGQHGFSAPMGYEYNFALLVLCLAVIVGGPGNLAIDRFFRRPRKN
jgi:putative oxidoreductase